MAELRDFLNGLVLGVVIGMLIMLLATYVLCGV
jgi:hypothetical protein